MSCPHCGSKDFIDTVRQEKCNRCKYEFYYGDAHSKIPEEQISKEINAGNPSLAKHKPEPEFYTEQELRDEYDGKE